MKEIEVFKQEVVVLLTPFIGARAEQITSLYQEGEQEAKDMFLLVEKTLSFFIGREQAREQLLVLSQKYFQSDYINFKSDYKG